MIVSVGNDVVLVDRFAAALRRTPLLTERLFTEAERTTRSNSKETAHGRKDARILFTITNCPR